MLRTHEDNFVGPRLLTYRPANGASFGRSNSAAVQSTVCAAGQKHKRWQSEGCSKGSHAIAKMSLQALLMAELG